MDGGNFIGPCETCYKKCSEHLDAFINMRQDFGHFGTFGFGFYKEIFEREEAIQKDI